MAEYTYKDIIIDPTSEEAKNAVGKKCFVSNIPISCLEHANENDYDFLTKLNSINLNLENPFNVKFNGVEHNFNSIIVKKEEPNPEYVPFKNQEEFVRTHQKIKESFKYDTFENNLANYGIWLKHKHTKSCSMVIKIENNGVILGNLQSADWRELFAYYTFIEGTPCGKYMEDSND